MLTPIVQEARRAGRPGCGLTLGATLDHRAAYLYETAAARSLDPKAVGDHSLPAAQLRQIHKTPTVSRP
jgi:hypothetical protein